MPAAGEPAPDIQANKDGSVSIHYVATKSGVHELSLCYNEHPVEGTPFRVNVDNKGSGSYLSAYGPGLVQGQCGEKLVFHVARGDSLDKIDVSIDGPGPIEVTQKEGQGGVVDVFYSPITPGEYDISVKTCGKHIHGSPFSAKISGEGKKRSQISVPTGEYVLGGNDVSLAGLVSFCKTPQGTLEPVLLKKMANGKLAVASFQPKKKGTYSIDVTHDGVKFPGAPFQIHVGDSEVCSPSKVKVTGAVKEGMANQWNEIHINLTEAGYGSLIVMMEGSFRCDLECKPKDRHDYILTYRPPEPGIYLLSFRYGDDHIAGSPFMVSVGGKPSGRVRVTATKQIQAAEPVSCGQLCSLDLKMPGASPLDMEAQLTSPSGKTELCEIRDSPGNLFGIKFTPCEVGTNVLSLKQKGIHIAGSPLQYTVGKSPTGGAYKVEFGGPGAERGGFGVSNEFNIYTHEAGPGLLSVTIDGPSKAKIDLNDRGGFVTVSYIVERDGEYTIGVKYDDEHVPKSPCKVHIDPECKEAKKVTIHGIRDRGLEVDKPATFTVNLNGVNGVLKGHVDTPSGGKDDLFIQEIDNEENSCRFLPKENGVYYVHLKFNDAHIPGSPFPMLIGKLGADPALVIASGKGLEKGETGKPCKFTVTTANAGSGTLAVTVEGTSKIALVCAELEDGYEFSYTPTAPGDYLFTIKYCNVGLAGSPFKAAIIGKGKVSDVKETSGLYVETTEKKPGLLRSKSFMGDASKVYLTGPGLKKGFCGRAANFSVDIKDAGQALLSIAIISPTGNPAKELIMKKSKPGHYNVSFMAEEKGDHLLYVHFGQQEITGSPFVINVS
jgi:filamin